MSLTRQQALDYFLKNKRQEWEAYAAQVTPYELRRFLPVL